MTTPYRAEWDTYWEGLSSLEMVENVQRWLGVAAADYNRYSKASIIQALNMGGERFTFLTGCLVMPVLLTCKANRQNYRLPYGSLRVLTARFYTGDDRTSYQELKILADAKQMQRIDTQYRGTTGNPDYLFPSYRAGNIWRVGVSPIPTSDGTVFSGATQGVITTATGFEFTGNITGRHKTGFPNSAFLVDSAGRNFVTLGAKVGYPVFNLTDGSSGLITAIGNQAATNDKITVTLSGGTDNDWDTDDQFEIPMSEYGVVMGQDEEAVTVSGDTGVIGDIYGGTGNIMLDVARKPLPLSATLDDMISEIPAQWQEAQIAFAVYWLGRGAFKGVMQAEKAAEALEVFRAYVAEANNEGLGIVEPTDKEVEYSEWWG